MILAAFADWFTASWPALGGAVVSSVAAFVIIILYTRLAGLRSYAKMSGIDFAMTIAVGSVLAATAMSKSTPLPVAAVTLATLFAGQKLLAVWRARSPWVTRVIDNSPILVMAEGRVLDNNLKRTSISQDELFAKLREANVLELSHVRAVVVESTGDVSVLHGDPSVEIDRELLRGVRDAHRFAHHAPQADQDPASAEPQT